MEHNRYAQHKQEIDRISREQGVDIGVACAMLRDEKGWFADEKDTEITAFTKFVGKMSGEEVRKYFAE